MVILSNIYEENVYNFEIIISVKMDIETVNGSFIGLTIYFKVDYS